MLDLSRDALHFDADLRMRVVPDFQHDYDTYEQAYCSEADPGRLATMHTTTEDWPVWECHPHGEELVLVLSGRAEFLQQVDGEIVKTEVGPGQAIVNPAGVPHTANVIEPFTALFITPGPGTTHTPR